MSKMLRRRLMMTKGNSSIPNYLCFTALEDGNFIFAIGPELTTSDLSYIAYSKDGRNFTTVNNVDSERIEVSFSVNNGDKVYLKGIATRTHNGNGGIYIQLDYSYNLSGNILSLLYGDSFENYNNVDFSVASRANLFRGLFDNTKVIDASELLIPITGVYSYAFSSMFSGCSSMILPPKKIPVAKVNQYALQYMFDGCTSMTTMPDLSSIANPTFRPTIGGFRYMFRNCSSMKYFTEIPYVFGGRSGENGSYSYMFYGCTSLEASPIKEIRGADNNVSTFGGTAQFERCFYGCTKLKTAPNMPVLTIKNTSYQYMFNGCSQLNYIKMLATSKTSSSLTDWVTGVAATGIFVKNINATWTDTGDSGVPSGWTVIYYDTSEGKYYTSQDKSQECDDHGNPI